MSLKLTDYSVLKPFFLEDVGVNLTLVLYRHEIMNQATGAHLPAPKLAVTVMYDGPIGSGLCFPVIPQVNL